MSSPLLSMSQTSITALFLLVLYFVYSPAAQSQQPDDDNCETQISDFIVTGNKVTLKEKMIYWSGLKDGQTVTHQDVVRAKKRLMNTELFRDVEIDLVSPCAIRSALNIDVREKRYHLLYPELSRNGDGDVEIGITYKGDNLYGSDHSLKLAVSQKEFINGDVADRLDFSYDLPMTSKPYELRWNVSSDETILSDTVTRVKETHSVFQFFAGRTWESSPLGFPVAIFAKILLQEKSFDQSATLIATRPGTFNALGLRLEHDKVEYGKYRRSGEFYSLDYEVGLSSLGSDFTAQVFQLEMRHFNPVNPTDNLNYRLKVSLASADIFNLKRYEVGGNDTLRGIESATLKGNGLWLGNIEYIWGFQESPNIRIAAFTDVGNLFQRYDQFNDNNWQLTYGVGLRWKVQSFVKTDLVLDYATDPETGYSKVYGSTSVNF
jgi:outer membrane protein assembly factor BamA